MSVVFEMHGPLESVGGITPHFLHHMLGAFMELTHDFVELSDLRR